MKPSLAGREPHEAHGNAHGSEATRVRRLRRRVRGLGRCARAHGDMRFPYGPPPLACACAHKRTVWLGRGQSAGMAICVSRMGRRCARSLVRATNDLWKSEFAALASHAASHAAPAGEAAAGAGAFGYAFPARLRVLTPAWAHSDMHSLRVRAGTHAVVGAFGYAFPARVRVLTPSCVCGDAGVCSGGRGGEAICVRAVRRGVLSRGDAALARACVRGRAPCAAVRPSSVRGGGFSGGCGMRSARVRACALGSSAAAVTCVLLACVRGCEVWHGRIRGLGCGGAMLRVWRHCVRRGSLCRLVTNLPCLGPRRSGLTRGSGPSSAPRATRRSRCAHADMHCPVCMPICIFRCVCR